jgi:hypothetical protein
MERVYNVCSLICEREFPGGVGRVEIPEKVKTGCFDSEKLA